MSAEKTLTTQPFRIGSTSIGSTSDSSFIDTLIHQARHLDLSSQRDWHVLLHYTPNTLQAGVTSLVDDPNFFLAEQGRHSPQAELNATLTALFHPQKQRDKAHPCRFPARRAFLIRALNINTRSLPTPSCPQLYKWMHKFKAKQLSIVFPVSSLNSPASLFGHTFLRFDQSETHKTDLLAWTANFAAKTSKERGLSYAAKGVLGLFPGKFSLTPYYQQVKTYSDIDKRDIWEYELNFTQAEINALLLHLWELMPVYFDYYFIDENCSYQLLSLLEAARPRLMLSDKFQWDATPAETIRAVTNSPGLLKRVNFRPSQQRIIKQRAHDLTPSDKKIAQGLADGLLTLDDAALKKKSHHQSAKIIELAIEHLNYRQPKSKSQRSLVHALSLARSNIPIESPPLQVPTPAYRPDQGHRSRRIASHYGYDHSPYIDLSFRWAYHDLQDSSKGFPSGAQLVFFQPRLRYYPDQAHLKLESVDFINIISAPLDNDLTRPFSWQTSAALTRYTLGNTRSTLLGDFKVGVGKSYALSENTRLSLFANSLLQVGAKRPHNSAWGFGSEAFAQTSISEKWQTKIYAQITQYTQPTTQISYKYGANVRFTVNDKHAISGEVKRERTFGHSQLTRQISWLMYF